MLHHQIRFIYILVIETGSQTLSNSKYQEEMNEEKSKKSYCYYDVMYIGD